MKLVVPVEYSRPLNSKPSLESAFAMASSSDTCVVLSVIANETHIGAAKQALEQYILHHELVLVVSDDPKSAIVAYCEDFSPHIVFVTTKKTSALERFVLGSTASHVVKNAPCSVMVTTISHK